MVQASGLRSGMVLQIDSELYKVVSADYHAGGGKMGGTTHAKLKNLHTGTFWERRFRPDEKLQDVELQRVTMQFIYQDGDDYYFMDPNTYEQTALSSSMIGPAEKFLHPEMRLPVELHDGKPVNVLFPEFIDLKVSMTAQPIHTQQDNTMKPATLENGMEILVPQFIKPGEIVRVEIETGKYLERVRHEEEKKRH